MSYNPGSMTPMDNAKTLGTMVDVALIRYAGAHDALAQIAEAFAADDVGKAKLIVGNYFSPGDSPGNSGPLLNLESALYDALPRGGDATSYG